MEATSSQTGGTPLNSQIGANPLTSPPQQNRHPALSLTNIKNHVSEVLDYTNFLLWRELFLPVLKGYNVLNHVDGSSTCPPLTDPGYDQWVQVDSLVLSWIQATISREILRQIITPGTSMTAFTAWEKVSKIFQDQVAARVIYFRQEFYHLEKGDLSMTAFLERLKELFDSLTSVGDSIQYKDVVLQIVMGLGPEYNHITTNISNRDPLPSFEECRSMLLLEETKLSKQQQRASLAASSSSSSAFLASHTPLLPRPELSTSLAHYASSMAPRGVFGGRRGGYGRGGSGRRGGGAGRGFSHGFQQQFGGRSFGSPRPLGAQPSLLGAPPNIQPQHHQFSPTPAHPRHRGSVQCYSCYGYGHVSRFCPFNQGSPGSFPQAFTAYPASDFGDSTWYMDSGASSHMTNNPGPSNKDHSSSLQ